MKWGPVAKKRTASATSWGVPLRRMGVLWAKCSYSAAVSSPVPVVLVFPVVTIMPGATQLTLISGAKALDMVCGEHVEGGFGGAVVGVGGPGVDSAEGADVDDAAAGGFEMRQRGL